MSALLALQGASKTFAEGFTLGPVNLELPSGGMNVAVVGPNGAGKSTLFQLITGQIDATSGLIHFKSHRMAPERADLKQLIGYLPQNPHLPLWVTAHELLVYAARLHKLENPEAKAQEAEERWSCDTYRHKVLGRLSHGMQKRVGLALATIAEPELLILDEPWEGLDIFQGRRLDEEIRARRAKGLTTVVSTHIGPFIAKLCDICFVVRGGEVRSLEAFRGQTPERKLQIFEDQFFSKSESEIS